MTDINVILGVVLIFGTSYGALKISFYSSLLFKLLTQHYEAEGKKTDEKKSESKPRGDLNGYSFGTPSVSGYGQTWQGAAQLNRIEFVEKANKEKKESPKKQSFWKKLFM